MAAASSIRNTCPMSPIPADNELAHLAARIQVDDVAAFEAVFRAFHAPLCEVVDGYVRSQAVAEDIVQDLFFVIWLKRRTLARVPLRPYLFAAARNQALRHLRHAAVVRRWSFRASRDSAVDSGAAAPMQPDRELEARETASALRAAIDELPPRSRVALVLRTEHAMSYADVAIAMGITIKGVEKLMSIAKTKLRQRLGAHGEAWVERA